MFDESGCQLCSPASRSKAPAVMGQASQPEASVADQENKIQEL